MAQTVGEITAIGNTVEVFNNGPLLESLSLQGTRLQNAKFIRCVLSEAILRDCSLVGCRIVDSDLRRCKEVDDCTIIRSKAEDCKLSNCIVNDAKEITGGNLEHCQIHDSDNINDSEVYYCVVEQSTLTRVTLAESDLRRCKMKSCKFPVPCIGRGCKVEGPHEPSWSTISRTRQRGVERRINARRNQISRPNGARKCRSDSPEPESRSQTLQAESSSINKAS